MRSSCTWRICVPTSFNGVECACPKAAATNSPEVRGKSTTCPGTCPVGPSSTWSNNNQMKNQDNNKSISSSNTSCSSNSDISLHIRLVKSCIQPGATCVFLSFQNSCAEQWLTVSVQNFCISPPRKNPGPLTAGWPDTKTHQNSLRLAEAKLRPYRTLPLLRLQHLREMSNLVACQCQSRLPDCGLPCLAALQEASADPATQLDTASLKWCWKGSKKWQIRDIMTMDYLKMKP